MSIRAKSSDPIKQVTVGFLLIKEFPLLSLSGATDVMRIANRFLDHDYYRSVVITSDGKAIKASNGLEITAEMGMDYDIKLDYCFVVCGFHPERVTDEKTLSWLRRLSRTGVKMGGISAGAFVLARAGLLNDRPCAVHWEYAGAFTEMWPRADLTDRLYVIDKDRLTCSGSIASIDMFLRLIGDEHGNELAGTIAEQIMVDRVRSSVDRQTSAAIFHAKARSKALTEAIQAMESNMDVPLSMIELSELVGLTRRQLHRLFRQHTSMSPSDFYRDLRLRYARTMLMRTSVKVIDIAIASGFGSHSHFSKVYREHFGVSPLTDRRSDQ